MVRFIQEHYLSVRYKDVLMTVLRICMIVAEFADENGEPFSVFKKGCNMCILGIHWSVIGETLFSLLFTHEESISFYKMKDR